MLLNISFNNLHNIHQDSYNNECPICIDSFNNNNESLQLHCNHTYHISCLSTYIETEFTKLAKQVNRETCLFCKQFKCPLCRKSIRCKDIKDIIYNQYYSLKEANKSLKKEIKDLQNQSYMLTFKFKCVKLFKNMQRIDVYNYLLEDETLLEQIMERKFIRDTIKKKLNTYEKLYYGGCFCYMG